MIKMKLTGADIPALLSQLSNKGIVMHDLCHIDPLTVTFCITDSQQKKFNSKLFSHCFDRQEHMEFFPLFERALYFLFCAGTACVLVLLASQQDFVCSNCWK